jgi:integrase
LRYRNASARGLDVGASRAGLNTPDVPKLSFHDLRQTFVSRLIAAGLDVVVVQRQQATRGRRSRLTATRTSLPARNEAPTSARDSPQINFGT